MVGNISLFRWFAGSMLLAGVACSTPQPPAAPPSAPDAAKPATPKVNRLVMGVGAPRLESNEMRHLQGPVSWPMRPMYEDLIGVDDKTGKLIPQLATDWTLDATSLKVTFNLRKGVPFHHGWGEFTANDLLSTYQEGMRDDSLNGFQNYWKGTLTGIEVVDDHKAVYQLRRPDLTFLEGISEQSGPFKVWSKKNYDTEGPPSMQMKATAGTAAYQFKERQQGQYLRFERVPYQHWRGMPDFPEFEFRWMREASTRMAALLAGEIQMADLPQDLHAQASQAGMKLVRAQIPALRTFLSVYCCNYADVNDASKGYVQARSALQDPRVRKALSKAINRDELNKAFFKGQAQPMHLNHFHPTTRLGWNPDWERRYPAEYGFDVNAARQSLTELGYTAANPVQVKLQLGEVAGYSGANDVAEAIANYWKAIGVQVELTQIDPAEFTSQTRAFRLPNHLAISATNNSQWGGVSNYGYVVGNRGGAEVAAVNEALRALTNTLDERGWPELWRKAGDAEFDAALTIPLFWIPVEAVVNPTIVGDWVYPGSFSGSWTHVQNIKAAR